MTSTSITQSPLANANQLFDQRVQPLILQAFNPLASRPKVAPVPVDVLQALHRLVPTESTPAAVRGWLTVIAH